MTRPPEHVVSRQRLEVEVASEALALALQPRLGDANRRRWLPAVERVLQEVDEPGRRLRIDRLDLDLGTVPFDRLEEVVERRLERELRRGIRRALERGEGRGSGAGVRRLSEPAARRELLEWELTTGTLPYWGRREASVPLEERVVAMMAEAPDDLAALVRSLGGKSPRVLERLARQLGDAALGELIRLLEPEHATLILAYVEDLRTVHRVERLVRRSDPELARALWILVQVYLVAEPGSRFNRRSFLRSLLERLAVREGVAYRQVLALLRRGLERLSTRRPLSSSLPAVVAELVAEASLGSQEPTSPGPSAAAAEPSGEISPASRRLFHRYDRVDALWALLRASPALWSELWSHSRESVEAAFAALPDLASSQLRAVVSGLDPGARERAVGRLARGLPEDVLAAWLRRLVPAAADPQSPLGASLETFAARADDPALLAAGVIFDVLEGDSLDLEAALARRVPPERIEPPGDPVPWRVVWAALAEIPVPYRPRPDALLGQMLRVAGPVVEAGRPWGEDVFGRLLAGLFTWPLPEPVGRFLLRRADAWAGSGSIPSGHAAAFRAALVAAGAPEPEAGREGQDARRRASRTRRAAVFEEERRALLELLRGERRSFDPDLLQRALESLLREPSREVRELLRREGADEGRRELWIGVLPESALARLTGLLAPRRHRELLAGAEILASAWIEAQGSGPPTFADRRVFWSFLLGFLARPGAGEPSVEDLVVAFFDHCAHRFRKAAREAPERAGQVGLGLLEAAEARAHRAGQAVLRAVLLQERRSLLAAWTSEVAPCRPRRPRRPPRRDEPGSGETPKEPEEPETSSDPLYVDNAGLVLAGAFLPHLLRELDFLVESDDGDVRLAGPETASRAVHLLQWLVDGRSDAPEALLVLNKLLLGLPLGAPVDRSVELTEAEREAGGKLLASMLSNWPTLSGTSVEGMQETFLQREGRLERTDEGWRLTVQRKTLDVLVDQVPWSLSVILHRWMPEAVYVTW